MSTALVLGGSPATSSFVDAVGGGSAPQSVRSASAVERVARPDGAAPARPASPADAPRVRLSHQTHGAAAVRALGDQLDEAAELNDMGPAAFARLLRSDHTAWVSKHGALYYVDARAGAAPAAGSTVAPTEPLADTFTLHSDPSSTHTLYLDFDGADVSSSFWTADFGSLNPIVPGWDPSGDGVGTFSDAERTSIQAIWKIVAADYAPFDVDVTTAYPGAAAIYQDSWADSHYGAHVVIGGDASTSQALCSGGCGGIAYVGAFGGGGSMDPGGSGEGAAQPAFVFPAGLGQDPKAIGEAASHELGHQFGLNHDGDATGEYHLGHGAWAPIMGAGYYRPISQWSKGDYPQATNQQNDVAIIASQLGLRADESGATVAEAAAAPSGTAYITSRDDQDTYLLGHCSGTLDVSATVAAYSNLDVKLTVRDAVGDVVASNDPTSAAVDASVASGLSAEVSQSVPDGYYYATVDGVGNGDWTTGYDDYDSLGAYTVAAANTCDGTWPTGVADGPADVSAFRPDDLVANTVTLQWTAPASTGGSAVTGYVVSGTGGVATQVLPADATSHTFSGLGFLTPYTFRIVAMNGQGPSHASSTTFTTPRQFVPPTAPTSVAATYQAAPRSATVTWGVPADDGGKPVLGYDVYLSPDPAHSFNGDVTAPASDVLVTSVAADVRSAVVPGIVQGQYNYLRVRARNAIGRGAVQMGAMLQPQPAPANDAFAARKTVTGTSGSDSGDSVLATGQANDPVPPHDRAGAGDSSVWFSWTAPASRVVTFSTGAGYDGVPRDTTLAAYTGSSLDALQLVAGNDDRATDDHTSRIRFDAVAGTTYAIAVDGYRAATDGVGPFALTWRMATLTTTSLQATPITHNRVDLNASVSGGGSPVGVVEFRQDGGVVGSVRVAGQQAPLSLTSVVGGSHTYSARFVPDDTADFAPSEGTDKTVTAQGTLPTVGLTASAESSTVTLRAAISDGATGTVRFRDGSTTVRTVPIADGVATATLSAVSAGAHSYVADYLPDTAAYDATISAAQGLTVNAPTTTRVATSVSGATVTVDVTVTGESGTPAGNVTLVEGATSQSRQVVNGVAHFVLGPLPAGDHTWAATYVVSGSPHTGSTGSGTATVAPWATKTTLTVTRANGGATLASTAQELVTGGRPVGSVEFRDGDALVATVPLTSGAATTTVGLVLPGDHAYTARFVPTSATSYAVSSATSDPFTVATGTSEVRIYPTVFDDHRVLLENRVIPTLGTAAGEVDLIENGEVVQTDVMPGNIDVSLFDVPSGPHTYTVRYRPWDPSLHTGSSATVTITMASTQTAISVGVETDAARRAHVLTAHVSSVGWSGTPVGSVVFYDGPYSVGDPVPVVDGVASLDRTGVPTGDHAYRASFLPTDPMLFWPASSPGTQPASMGLSPTTTVMTADAQGQTVTLTATVSSPYRTPGGQVQFTIDGAPLQSVYLDADGVATLVRSGVAVGDHTFAASYADDESYAQVYDASEAPPTSVAVTADPVRPVEATTTSVAVSHTGRSVTLGATVAGGSGGVPTGSVVLYDGATPVGFGWLDGGAVSVPLGPVAVGDHRYRAAYFPDDQTVWAASESDAQDVTITPTATTTTLRGAVSGTVATLTATVGGGDAADRVGTVIFRDGSREVAQYLLVGSDSTATVEVTAGVGPHSYAAEFVPTSSDVAGSTSSPVSLSVAKLISRTTLVAPTKAKVGSQPTVKVAVTRGGLPAAGRVVLSVNGAKVRLTLRSGTASYKLPRLKKGTTRLVAAYAGDATTLSSSAARAIAVK